MASMTAAYTYTIINHFTMKDVFDAYPKVDKIYVVDGMPFFTELEALNHAGGKLEKVQTVTREDAEAAAAEVGGDADTPPAPEGEEVDADKKDAPKKGKK